MNTNQKAPMLSRVFAPRRVEDAWELKITEEECFVSAGTFLQVNWEAGIPVPNTLISLDGIEDMKRVVPTVIDGNDYVKIGALTTLAKCQQHSLIVKYAPLLSVACSNIAAPAVRNRGTIGGNIACGIGDSIPALLVLGAKIIIYQNSRYSTVSVKEWFESKQVTPYLICSLLIPFGQDIDHVVTHYRKVGRREAFTPTLVTISVLFKKTDDRRLKDIRIAIGGGQHIPMRLPLCEAILEGNMVSHELLKKAHSTILKEAQSYSDTFATSEYRKTVAANLIIAFIDDYFSKQLDRETDDEIK